MARTLETCPCSNLFSMSEPSCLTVTTPTVMSSEHDKMCPEIPADLNSARDAGGRDDKIMLWMAPVGCAKCNQFLLSISTYCLDFALVAYFSYFPFHYNFPHITIYNNFQG